MKSYSYPRKLAKGMIFLWYLIAVVAVVVAVISLVTFGSKTDRSDVDALERATKASSNAIQNAFLCGFIACAVHLVCAAILAVFDMAESSALLAHQARLAVLSDPPSKPKSCGPTNPVPPPESPIVSAPARQSAAIAPTKEDAAMIQSVEAEEAAKLARYRMGQKI